ncbi:unnamed protein product [Victoria cruziana]
MAASSAMGTARWSAFATNHNRIDWAVTPEAYIFSASLPGSRKEEIALGIEGSQYICIETASVGGGRRGFWRKFRLPDGVDVARVSAEFRNGVLSITVPRLAPPPALATRFRIDPMDVAADCRHAVARAA